MSDLILGPDGSSRARRRSSYWRRWTEPPTLITIAAAAATVYGSQVVQAERIDAMRRQMEAIERDYQRRDVLAERLSSIDGRLYSIEIKLGERERPERRPNN